MALRRLHVSDIGGDVLRISGAEAKHALKVLRLVEGHEVIVFDGRGGEAVGRIVATARDAFDVQITRRHEASPGAAELTIAVAPPKGERADWLVEKCAELGVARLIPVICDRSQVRPGDSKIERWRRKAVEAAKQSRQARTMMIDAPIALEELVIAIDAGTTIFFGDADPECPGALAAFSDSASVATLIIIGPEGGLADGERAAVTRAGGCGVRLATSILRIETAAVAAAAIWAASRLSAR